MLGESRHRSVLLALATAAVVVVVLVPIASANTILQVNAASGSDTGNCQGSPCRTLTYALGQARLLSDTVTIQVAAGTYTEDLTLLTTDNPVTIIGAGSGTDPATSTIIQGVNGNPTFQTNSLPSLRLSHLRVFNPPGDNNDGLSSNGTELGLNDAVFQIQGTGSAIADAANITATGGVILLQNPAGAGTGIVAGGAAISLTNTPIDTQDSSDAISNGGGPVSLSNSPITLENTTSSSPAIANGSGDVTLDSSPIDIKGSGSGIQNGGAPVTVTSSSITIEGTGGSGTGIANGSASVTVSNSPIDVRTTGYGITNGGGPVSVTNSPITLENTGGSQYAIANGGAAVTVTNSTLDVRGNGGGIANGGGPVSVSSSPITLENTGGSAYAIANGGAAVTVTNSPLDVRGTAGGITNGGGAVSVTNSPITLENTGGSAYAIANSGAAVTDENSALDVRGSGGGIANGGGPVGVDSTSITIENTTTGGTAIVNPSGAVTVNNTTIDERGPGGAINSSAAPATLTATNVTMDNATSSSPALQFNNSRSSLAHVAVSGPWRGDALIQSGSADIADSTFMSGAGSVNPLAFFASGSSTGHTVNITRSAFTQGSPTQPTVSASNVNMTIDSSALLGGMSSSFAVTGGNTRLLTVVSSTIDAGALGSRDAGPVASIAASSDDNSPDSTALVDIEGSILVEPPTSTTGASHGNTTVNCTFTEVPNTTQAQARPNGAINCATGVKGNTFTSSLRAIFQAPGSNYQLNPSFSGVDSLPAGAISLPGGRTASATDLAGHPRVQNGVGTCTPPIEDKGALELENAGVVPAPQISGPAAGTPGSMLAFTGSAPNVPSGVPQTFSWHSSDGGSGTGAGFSHAFAAPGVYSVSLTGTGATACVGSTTRVVFVTPGIQIDKITALSVSPTAFFAAPSGPTVIAAKAKPKKKKTYGAVVSYRDSQPAITTFTVQKPSAGRRVGKSCVKPSKKNRKRKQCTRYLGLGSFTHTDAAGANRFRFVGRVGGHALHRGSYRLQAIPMNIAGRGAPVFVSFRIK